MPERPDPVGRVEAAGGVLWQRVDGQVQVAVVHRARYNDWSLPKGKLDRHEPGVLAAVREVREETGCDAVAGRRLGESRYLVLDGLRTLPKTVRWWAMRATGGAFTPGAEVDAVRWLDVRAAQQLVSAGRDVAPLAAFAEHPAESSMVLVLRHGSAGKRKDWSGPDDERPLDDAGRSQAAAAAAVLPVYGPGPVWSAPPLRCRQTVEPLAVRLGTEIQIDSDLAQDCAAALPDRLLRLASERASTVACSQGGAIPYALTALAEASGLTLSAPTAARKGSLWALSFSARRLVGADYTADLTD